MGSLFETIADCLEKDDIQDSGRSMGWYDYGNGGPSSFMACRLERVSTGATDHLPWMRSMENMYMKHDCAV
jgi:hypothetical protein